MKIVFASHNGGKIRELSALVQPFNIEIIPQALLSVSEIPETGLTFVENALLKARHAALQTGLPAIADDSGLEVSALNGAPGIYSARFAGLKATAVDNNKKLLAALTNVPKAARAARYYCALVFLLHAEDPTPLICEGTWEGTILETPHGEQGFGYDPLFFDVNEQCSAAELPLAKKNQKSHRGQALRQLIAKLPEKLSCMPSQ
jgi:XTP/dITP diphosphohydrolase